MRHFLSNSTERTPVLLNALAVAETPANDLMLAVADRCRPGMRFKKAAMLQAIAHIEHAAWHDAALAMLAAALPAFTMRRLVLEDDVWLCTLSKAPAMPIELDDTIEASHTSIPLAIATCIVMALDAAPADSDRNRSPAGVPQASGYALGCENYA